ncbi:MAG: hypothetical protein WDN00_08900 [Limisphaerales bacterium]
MKSIVVPIGFSVILVGILIEYGSYVSQTALVSSDTNSQVDSGKIDSAYLAPDRAIFTGSSTNSSDMATTLR